MSVTPPWILPWGELSLTFLVPDKHITVREDGSMLAKWSDIHLLAYYQGDFLATLDTGEDSRDEKLNMSRLSNVLEYANDELTIKLEYKNWLCRGRLYQVRRRPHRYDVTWEKADVLYSPLRGKVTFVDEIPGLVSPEPGSKLVLVDGQPLYFIPEELADAITKSYEYFGEETRVNRFFQIAYNELYCKPEPDASGNAVMRKLSREQVSELRILEASRPNISIRGLMTEFNEPKEWFLSAHNVENALACGLALSHCADFVDCDLEGATLSFLKGAPSDVVDVDGVSCRMFFLGSAGIPHLSKSVSICGINIELGLSLKDNKSK